MSQHTHIKRVEDLAVGDVAIFNVSEHMTAAALITGVDVDQEDPVRFDVSYVVEIQGEVRETTVQGSYSQPVQVLA